MFDTMKHSKHCRNERIYKMHGVESTCMGSRCVPTGNKLERKKYRTKE